MSPGADRRAVAHVDLPFAQLGNGGVEIVDENREVLALVGRRVALDEMQLLTSGVEPRAGEAEVGPVLARREAEGVDVEPQRGVDVVDGEGHMVDGDGFHDRSLSPAVMGRSSFQSTRRRRCAKRHAPSWRT